MYQFPVGVLPENFELNSVQVANPYQRALLSKTLRCEKKIHWLFQKSILSITQKSEMWCFPIKPTQNVSLLLNCFGFVQLFFKQYVQYIAFYICTHTHNIRFHVFSFSLSRGWAFDVRTTHTELNSETPRRLVQSALAIGIDGLHHLMSQSARVLSKNLTKNSWKRTLCSWTWLVGL